MGLWPFTQTFWHYLTFQNKILLARNSTDKSSLIQSIQKQSDETTFTVGKILCGSATADVTGCPRGGPSALRRGFNVVLGNFCNTLLSLGSEFLKDSDHDSDSIISDSEKTNTTAKSKNTHTICFTPAIDLLISREGVSVKDLMVPSVAKFADAQLKDSDLILLRKWIIKPKFFTSEDIAGFSARVKKFA